MSNQNEDLRAYLVSLLDGKDAHEVEAEAADNEAKASALAAEDVKGAEGAEKSETAAELESGIQPHEADDVAVLASAPTPEPVTSLEDLAALTTEELFQQGAKAARKQRRRREAIARKKQAAEADAWLRNSVRDETTDSSRGFDFLDDDDDDDEIPPLDEWPAFADIDRDNIVTRYGTSDTRDIHGDEGALGDLVGGGDGAVPEAAPARKGSAGRVIKSFAGRFVGAVAVLALAAVAVYGSARGHTQSQNVDASSFQGAPALVQLACTGAFERSVEAGVNVEEVNEQITDSALLLATGNASNGNTRVQVPSSNASAAGNSTDSVGIVNPSQARGVFRADENSAELAGLNVHRAAAGDMRGLASVACLNGQVDAYLVGSEISVGTSNELVLVNLSFAPATVHLEALGSVDFLDASTIKTIVVDAQSVKRVSLDGAIDGDKRLALHVTASSGTVAAFVQETALEGAKPAGVSWISPSASAEHLVIPGLSIPFDSVEYPRVRIANFENKAATVSVALQSESGALERADLTNITVAAHSVLDIPLDGIDVGIYTAVITSDIPVSAGGELAYRQSDDAPREIAWAGAVSPAYESIGVFGSVTSTLVLAGDEAGKADVFIYNRAGTLLEKSTVEISDAHSTVVTMPSDAVAVRVSGDVPVSAAIMGQLNLDDGMGIDWLPLVSRPDDIGRQRISVW